MRTRYTSALAVLLVAAFAPTSAPAQCNPAWSNPFPAQGVDGIIHTLAVFDDDATGPHPSALYAAGSFSNAGGVSAGRIAKWNGTAWSAVGPGMSSTVFALCVFDDDDTGAHLPALYAAGNFETIGIFQYAHIAKWNGTAWTGLGTGLSNQAYAMAVYDDDGTGPHLPALYVGGLFTSAGGVPAANIAKWDGTSWSALASGFDNYVNALAVFDPDGSGPSRSALVAGGGFQHSGTLQVNHIAKWDGTAWSALPYLSGSGVNDIVNAMAVYDDDGAGPNIPALYVGGLFTTASGVPASHIAKWTGSAWSAVGTGVNAAVSELVAFDADGTGAGTSKLIAGGSFTTAGGNPANYIAQWNGSAWSALGTGLNNGVFALCTFDPDPQTGNNPVVYAGGDFSSAGGAAAGRIARWACPYGGTAPTINVHPQSQSICAGSSVTFTVTASGSPTLTYQWRKGGQNILNATQSSYTINPVSAPDAGSYDVVVTNDYGTATSNPAVLTVLNCVPPTITVQPQSQSVCVGDSVTFSVTATGEGTLSYQWRLGGLDIQNAHLSSYTINPVGTGDAGDYDVVVSNAYGGTPSDPATLTVSDCLLPNINVQPQSQTVCSGGSVTFTVSASGAPPLSYQWRKAGIDIQDATDSSYTINPVGSGDAGTYDVVVTNDHGSATSDPATLTVSDCVAPTIDVQPQSQTICSGSSVTFAVSASGDPPLSYQWRKSGTDIQGAIQSSYTIFPLALTDAGVYDVVVTNPGGSTSSDPATLTVQNCRGDMNCDGQVNAQDIDGFIDALFGLASQYDEYLHTFPVYVPCSMTNADFNGDGLVNSQDIDGFITCLFGGGC